MGDPTSQSNAQNLRDVLVGLSRFDQHKAAIQWAIDHDCVIDMFGDFAKDHHLLLFQSGNECENWIDPLCHMVYKMNMLVHVGEDILKLLERVDHYNYLFPHIALRFVGFHVMGPSNAYPVFKQPFVDNVRFATREEILAYMAARGFEPQSGDGVFSDGKYILSDIKPKNVLASDDGMAIFVIDADIEVIS